MLLTIIPSDSAVYCDKVMLQCDLSGVSLPASLHAFQWDGVRGEIEFATDSDGQKPANVRVQALPAWALECESIYARMHSARIEAARVAAVAIAKHQPTVSGTQEL